MAASGWPGAVFALPHYDFGTILSEPFARRFLSRMDMKRMLD